MIRSPGWQTHRPEATSRLCWNCPDKYRMHALRHDVKRVQACDAMHRNCVFHYFTRVPPFSTNVTRRMTVMSTSGLPRTAMMSATLPCSTVPTVSSTPRERAGQ